MKVTKKYYQFIPSFPSELRVQNNKRWTDGFQWYGEYNVNLRLFIADFGYTID